MRVLLLGAGGMLGHDLVAAAPPNVQLSPLTRQALDITDAVALREAIHRLRPECIVNAAAYTAVDRAEQEPDLAHNVNGFAVRQLGLLAKEAGARVVHFSTDYVFDGLGPAPYREDAATNPINVYGASKLAGEQALIASGWPALVIRSQWLFGARGRSFPTTILRRARERKPTRVVDDQLGRPTYTKDLAVAAWTVISLGTTGLIHVTNDDEATWFDVAHEIFSREGALSLLSRCSSSEYPTAARRPRDSRLNTERAEILMRDRLPPWRDAVERFLTDCRASDVLGSSPS